MSFTLGRYDEWFGDHQHSQPVREGLISNSPVIITRSFSGAITLLALHEGSVAELSRAHANLTNYLVVNYARNREVIARIEAHWRERSERVDAILKAQLPDGASQTGEAAIGVDQAGKPVRL